jgi:Rieske 2Fe-2S family protein
VFIFVGQEEQQGDNGAGPSAALGDQLLDLPQRFAAYRMADLRLARRIVYDVRANWKLVVLNYNECLHCPTLHPALNRLHHYLAADNVAPTSGYCGGAMGFRAGVETVSVDGARRRACLPGLDDEQRQQVAYYAIYPNLLLSLHPDYMMTHTLWPRAHDRTEIVCEWHFHPEEMATAGFNADDAVALWDATNREDWWICEQSQAGIQSRAYVPGPYSEREALLWSFDDIVRHEMEEP